MLQRPVRRLIFSVPLAALMGLAAPLRSAAPTFTPSFQATGTPTSTSSATPTITPGGTFTITPSFTVSPLPTDTPSPSPDSPTVSPTATPSGSPSPTATPSATQTPPFTPSATPTSSPSLGPTPPSPPTSVLDPGDGAVVYPLPGVEEDVKLVFSMASPGSYRVRLFNAAGDPAGLVEDRGGAGPLTVVLPTASFAPGIYLFKVNMAYDDGSRGSLAVGKFVMRRR